MCIATFCFLRGQDSFRGNQMFQDIVPGPQNLVNTQLCTCTHNILNTGGCAFLELMKALIKGVLYLRKKKVPGYRPGKPSFSLVLPSSK